MKRGSFLKRSRMKKNGRKSLDWMKVRRRLSAEFLARGIISCELKYEGCWGKGALSWAHGKKRRHLQGDELATLLILSCTPCHQILERLPESEMCAIVENVIAARDNHKGE
jgi:hypothetical protein